MSIYEPLPAFRLAEIVGDANKEMPGLRFSIAKRIRGQSDTYSIIQRTDDGETEIMLSKYPPLKDGKPNFSAEILRIDDVYVAMPLYRLPKETIGHTIAHIIHTINVNYRVANWNRCEGVTYKRQRIIPPHKGLPYKSRIQASRKWTKDGKRCPNCSQAYDQIRYGNFDWGASPHLNPPAPIADTKEN